MELVEVLALFGGVTVIATGVASFASSILQKRLLTIWERNDTKRTDILKGEIDRNNRIIDNLTSSVFSHSQEINQERLVAIKELWSGMLKMRESVPSLVQTIYHIMLEEEVTVENLNRTKSNFGRAIQSINLEDFANTQHDTFSRLKQFRPFVTEKLWLLVWTFQLVIGRGTGIVVNGYQSGRITYWTKDDYFLSILAISLSKEEIEYLKSIKVNSFEMILQLLESKAILEMNRLITGEIQTERTIDQLKRIEKYLKERENQSK
jgi:hypothetical protein